MRALVRAGCLVAVFWTNGDDGTVRGATPGISTVGVCVGPDAPALERFAAEELRRYVRQLYGIQADDVEEPGRYRGTIFLIGSIQTNPKIAKALAPDGWPKVSDQGIVIKRARIESKPALIVGGGSPVATMWAVYELIQRWGVTYLLHGDVLPARPDPQRAIALDVPESDVVMEPTLPIRWWRTVNDFACGPESWGIAQYRIVLGQLAKMKFNRIYLSLWPWQPFLDPDIQSVKRKDAYLWFDYHYPVTDDMPGRKVFGDVEEFWNPDLPHGAPTEEFVRAGIEYCHQITELARSLGMQCGVSVSLTDYPKEFGKLLKNPKKVHQLAELTVGPSPRTPIDDPQMTALAGGFLRTTVNTYPECDFVMLGMPEFRAWSGHHKKAWNALDAKYGIEKVRPLAKVIEQAKGRTGYPGGADRALQEVKGDIVALYFYDRLIHDEKILEETRRPDVKVVYMNAAEELFPVLPKLMPEGGELLNFVDYTASRIVKRKHVLEQLPGREVPTSLIFTLHDDNVGLMPQLTTGSFDALLDVMVPTGWSGLSTRYWLIGDHNLSVGYIARRAWERGLERTDFYRRQLTAVCGEPAAEGMLEAMQTLEQVTIALEERGLGLMFPVPGMLMKFWKPGELPEYLVDARHQYIRALNSVRKADRARRATLGESGSRARSAAADEYLAYWMSRFTFGAGYIETIEAVHKAATAEAQAAKARKAGKLEEHKAKLAEAARLAREAEQTVRNAIDAYAHVARDQSDCGAIAILAEYAWRPIRDKARQLQAEVKK